MLGVAQRTISDWLNGHEKENICFGGDAKANIDNHQYEDKSLNSNVKVSPKTKQELLKMTNEGKTQEQVAAELKLSQPTVSRIIAKDKKDAQKKNEAAAKVEGRATVELASAVEWQNNTD